VSFDLKNIAHIKNQQTGHPFQDWFLSIESASLSLKSANVDDTGLEHVVLASATPTQFTTFARLLYQYAKSYPKGDQTLEIFFNFVNASNFDLSGWIDATTYLHDWLLTHNRKIDFHPMLGYLECCAAAPEARDPGQTLRSVATYMLETWDYEAG
jgi:hypothetical protein